MTIAHIDNISARNDELQVSDGEEYDELVVARDISCQSLCQHHLLPIKGMAHVAYLLGKRTLGLSKLARVVELFACNLQVQERAMFLVRP